MKEWQKELYQYRLSPTPPKKDLQEYIDLYLAEKEKHYLSWFLHYYEPILNTTVMGIVQRYSMYGHFLDLKEACILGILRALEAYEPQSKVPFITYKTRIMWEGSTTISALCEPDSQSKANTNTATYATSCVSTPYIKTKAIPKRSKRLPKK